MNSDDSLDLMTLFTQSRSDANIHYIGIGQRLNDISCKVVERLRPLIGLTLGENSLRKLKAQIPNEETKQRIQQLPPRHWIYLDGKQNPEIEIPIFKKEGKPTQLKPQIPQAEPKQKGLRARLQDWLTKVRTETAQRKLGANSQTTNSEETEETFEDVEYPEEDYPDKTDADLIEFGL